MTSCASFDTFINYLSKLVMFDCFSIARPCLFLIFARPVDDCVFLLFSGCLISDFILKQDSSISFTRLHDFADKYWNKSLLDFSQNGFLISFPSSDVWKLWRDVENLDSTLATATTPDSLINFLGTFTLHDFISVEIYFKSTPTPLQCLGIGVTIRNHFNFLVLFEAWINSSS